MPPRKKNVDPGADKLAQQTDELIKFANELFAGSQLTSQRLVAMAEGDRELLREAGRQARKDATEPEQSIAVTNAVIEEPENYDRYVAWKRISERSSGTTSREGGGGLVRVRAKQDLADFEADLKSRGALADLFAAAVAETIDAEPRSRPRFESSRRIPVRIVVNVAEDEAWQGTVSLFCVPARGDGLRLDDSTVLEVDGIEVPVRGPVVVRCAASRDVSRAALGRAGLNVDPGSAGRDGVAAGGHA